MKYFLLLLLLIGLKVSAQDYITTANKCYDEKNYQCAIDNYLASISNKSYQEKDYALIEYRIGHSYSQLDKLAESIAYFQNAIGAKSDFGDAYWDLAYAYYSVKEYAQALDNYTKAIEFYKSSPSSLKSLYYSQGLAYDALNKNENALASYEQSFKMDSTYDDAYAMAGSASYDLKKYSTALEYYNKAIGLGTKDKAALVARYRMRGKAYSKLGKHDEAIADARKALELDPSTRAAAWNIASYYYNQKKYTDAISQYTKCLELYKNDTASTIDIYYWRGLSYSGANNYSKALADLDVVLKAEPDDVDAIWEKGSIYYKQKKYKEAIPFYSRAIELSKGEKTDLDDLHFFRGKCLLELKDSTKAIADFKESLAFNSLLRDPNIEMGNISYAGKKYSDAASYYNKGAVGFTTDSSTLSQLYFKKGYANLITNSAFTGKADLEMSIRYDSLNKEAHRYLGEAYYASNSFYSSGIEFDKCIRLYRNVKDSLHKMYCYHGMALSKQSKFAEALNDYEQADKLNPGNADYITGIGQLAFETKDYNKVISTFNKALTIYKPDQKAQIAFAYYAKGRSAYELKNKDQAIADISKALEFYPDYKEAKQWLDYIQKGSN
jgi:tetratricopeptide (TPR) repeat protein